VRLHLLICVPKPKAPRKPKPPYRAKTPPPSGDHVAPVTSISPGRFRLGEDGTIAHGSSADQGAPILAYHDDARRIWLYHGNCLELLDAITATHPEGRFDCIFADPPYFLSNGGITCHAGKM